MNQNRTPFIPCAALLASFAAMTFATEPPATDRVGASDPAPEAVSAQPAEPSDATPAPERGSVRPGRAPRGREMTPEMRAYVDRLDAIRLARDEQARIAVQAESDIQARKETLASENEKVGELARKAAELRASLEEVEKALADAYAADEALVALESKKEAAEKARDDKQREMHAAVAAAMDERTARFRTPRPAAPAPAISTPAPAPASAE